MEKLCKHGSKNQWQKLVMCVYSFVISVLQMAVCHKNSVSKAHVRLNVNTIMVLHHISIRKGFECKTFSFHTAVYSQVYINNIINFTKSVCLDLMWQSTGQVATPIKHKHGFNSCCRQPCENLIFKIIILIYEQYIFLALVIQFNILKRFKI